MVLSGGRLICSCRISGRRNTDMWTEAAKDAILIREVVNPEQARHLLYQARVNLELFNHTRSQLHEALNQLNFRDFARVNSCHMTEGIFGEDIHAAHMITEKERVIGFLLATVTAGHRFTRSIIAARARDMGPDWKGLKIDITLLEKKFHKVRNFMEHLDEAIASGTLASDMDCTFTPGAILTCKEPSETFTFDFSEQALLRPQETYDKVIDMLKARKELKAAGA